MNETRKPPTKEALKSRAVRILDKMMDDHEKAPSKGQFNKFLGKYNTTKNDVIKEATANLKLVNTISNLYGHGDVVTFEDEEDVKLPTISIDD
mgnify:CR=1 FL=1|tara:strand:- start:195 stop:473 length:279 start_codon:yes stop_codon:yes gene_type:complete